MKHKHKMPKGVDIDNITSFTCLICGIVIDTACINCGWQKTGSGECGKFKRKVNK